MKTSEVAEIRALNTQGIGYAQLARRFNVGKSTIARAVRGDNWDCGGTGKGST